MFGARFQNPLLLAAGTAGFGRELSGAMDLHRLGGIVTKAVSLEPRGGNLPPRVAEFRGGMINSVGLANPGVRRVVEGILPWLARHLSRPQVLVNVVGFRESEYVEVIEQLDSAEGFLGYELNLSCPNTSHGGVEFGADAGAITKVVGAVRKVTKRPLVVKLSPALPDIAGMAQVARDAGADGIAVVNTMPGLVCQGPPGVPRLGNGNGGVSGPALLPVGLLAVRRVVDRLAGSLPVIGVGGIRVGKDVDDYLASGATLVAVGTAALADPRVPERIISYLERRYG